MLRNLTKQLAVAGICVALICNTFFPCLAKSKNKSFKPAVPNSIKDSKDNSSLNPLSPTHSFGKSLPKAKIQQEAGKNDRVQGIESQGISRPFNNIEFTGDALIFTLPKNTGVFSEAISATINGEVFLSIRMKKNGRKLVLSGNPGGRSLESHFAGGKAAVAITNGDGVKQYLVLSRQNDNVSVLLPQVNDFNPRHAAPGASISISGANFSPTPADNTIIFRDREGKEYNIPVVESSESNLKVLIPPIPLSTDLKTFYTGSIEIRVQTASAYASNSSSLTVDSLPDNSGPIGSIAQDYIQQLKSLDEEIENDIAASLSNLNVEGVDSGLVKALRELPNESLVRFRSMISDAKEGHPQSILVDIDDDGIQERVTVDLNAIDLLERLLIRANSTSQLANLRHQLFVKQNTLNSIVESSGCTQSESLILFYSTFAKMLKENLETLTQAKLGTVIGIALGVASFGCVPCALATIYAALLLVSWAELVFGVLLTALNINPTKLSRVNVSPSNSTIRVGGNSQFAVTGTFTNDTSGALSDLVVLGRNNPPLYAFKGRPV